MVARRPPPAGCTERPFWWRGRAWWAYAVAYLIFNGELVEGQHRAHLCHNNRCVNHDHIEQQDASENVAERNRRFAAARTCGCAEDIPF